MSWLLVIKIAFGGFATVFIILSLLCLVIWMTKSVVDKIKKNDNRDIDV